MLLVCFFASLASIRTPGESANALGLVLRKADPFPRLLRGPQALISAWISEGLNVLGLLTGTPSAVPHISLDHLNLALHYTVLRPLRPLFSSPLSRDDLYRAPHVRYCT